jgi:alkyl hydroperoxide reductase subunit AhpC
MTVRSLFIIDPGNKLRSTLTYPASIGWNFAEILRAIDSLQLTDGYKVATYTNWRDGGDYPRFQTKTQRRCSRTGSTVSGRISV